MESYEIKSTPAVRTKAGWIPAEGKVPACYVIDAEDYHALVGELRRLSEAEDTRMGTDAAEWKEKFLHEESLNRNLRRIATERANRARGVDKLENGYLIKGWSEFTHRRRYKGVHHYHYEEIPLCRILIQTPIDCSIPLDDADYEIRKDLASGRLKLGDDIGWSESKKSLDEAIGESQARDMILQMQWRSDVRVGLWEVTLITNFEPAVREEHRYNYF